EADFVEVHRANALFDAHRDDSEFGYRYRADDAEAGAETMAVRTAWRLCSDNAWFSTFVKGRARSGKKPGTTVHDGLCIGTDADGRVRHEFRATAVDELWLTDITEHWTDEGKLYMCAIKDVYSSRIVGYSIGARMKARLAVDALEMAVARRGGDVAGCVTHSDRSSQFRSKKFTVGKWLPVARVYRNGSGSVRRVAATKTDEGCVYQRSSAPPSPTPVSGSTGTKRYRARGLSTGFAHAVVTTFRDVPRMSRSSGPSAIPPRIPVASAFEMQMGPSMSHPEDFGTYRWCAAHVGPDFHN